MPHKTTDRFGGLVMGSSSPLIKKKPCVNRSNKRFFGVPPRSGRTDNSLFTRPDFLASEILSRLNSSFDSSHALAVIAKATGGDFYVFGGTVRKAILNENHSGDLDIIIENGNDKIYEAFSRLGLVYTLNSKGHHRYQWNKLQIDVCQPIEFFSGYNDATEMLKNVDLKINSVAFHFKTKNILDPYSILKTNYCNPGINWNYWRSVNALNFAVASIRLARLLFDSPKLKLSTQDVNGLRKFVIPKLESIDWNLVISRFPEGREIFIKTLLSLIKDHSTTYF